MTKHPTTSTPTATPEQTEARDRSIITVLLIATFVVILNETIMNVALPRLSKEFNVAASVVQWLATAFMLTMAVVIPATGFLMQRLTTRTVFFAAMGIFGLGTLLAGFAPNFEILLLARIAQAIGTAIMTPLLFTTVLTLVPAIRRGAVMGTITIVIAVAPALGPTVGGAILQYLSWRYLFFFVLPIVLAVTAYGARTLVNYSEPQRVSLDLPSLPLAALGFGGLVYSLSSLGESHAGLGDPLVGGSLLVSLVSLGLFVWRQIFLQRHGTPLLDFRVLRYPIYTLGLTVLALLALVLFGSGILLPMYVQQVRGLDPLQTGLLMLPGGLLMGLLSPAAPSTQVSTAPHEISWVTARPCPERSAKRSVSPPSNRMTAMASEVISERPGGVRTAPGSMTWLSGPSAKPTSSRGKIAGIRSREASTCAKIPSATMTGRATMGW